MSGSTLDAARSAKPRALETFAGLVEVVGIGITRDADGFVLKINLRQPPPAGVDLPTDIDGVPVRIEVVGRIHRR